MNNKPMETSKLADIFTCTRCGFCCQGETTVSLDQRDQERMITALGLSRDEVTAQFWRITGSVVQMQTRDGHCIFFHPDSGCTVHDGRPWRCRQWPLHPSMVTDANNFQVITDSCPGLQKGLSHEEFCKIFNALLERGDISKMRE